MKAYKIWTDDSEYSAIVYAESANKARAYAKDWVDAVDGADYIDIRAKRMPKCDGLYNGKAEGDWCDMELRKVLVEEYGWYCIEPDIEDCLQCKLCDYYEDETQEYLEEVSE